MIRTPQGVIGWWRGLVPDQSRPNPSERAGDRAALARLRRCASLAEAMQEPATIALFRQCGATDEKDLVAIALAAAVLAHVRRDRPGERLARQIGPDSPDKPETATLKPLRFRRLLEASEPEECLIVFRRLVALAGGEANVADLSRALFDWPDLHRGPETKRRWIFTYWNAEPAPPATPAKDTAA
ncbi:CRISPR system Cascade subunit CasB [Humitalea rosea]|uniref:CRISPR system Cascade subunit CasB n=1 Tax=Humitalea rosea TaxID=990373 RepID=A0A2W7ICU6_9PROT|nr:type I-E CRISPR-associated protein Cse2/CasB [Humitalea rosea]PZW44786.1 CRISPR system Cascade subunit CasB [Humitalea rosea]